MAPKLNEVFSKTLNEEKSNLSPGAVAAVKDIAKTFGDIVKGISGTTYKDDQDLLMDIYSMAEKATALQKQLSDAIKAGKKMTTFQDPMEG